MLEKLREFFRKPAGMAIAGIMVLIGLLWALGEIRSFTTSEAAALSRDRMYIDAKTGKPFEVELRVGLDTPCDAPSGGKTGYPAEACYWTKDGKEKKDPTYVLLNTYKGSKDPTFCPDCGRLVVGHNPPPGPDIKPPPTKEEYAKSGRGSGSRR